LKQTPPQRLAARITASYATNLADVAAALIAAPSSAASSIPPRFSAFTGKQRHQFASPNSVTPDY
jgi:hypothetical protein